MKPITTWEELARMEEAFRLSERTRIGQYIRSCREDDTDRPRVQVFDVLASQVERSEHWRLPPAEVETAPDKIAEVIDFAVAQMVNTIREDQRREIRLPKRKVTELIEALRIRALALTGEKWERDATRDMMKEAAQQLEDMNTNQCDCYPWDGVHAVDCRKYINRP